MIEKFFPIDPKLKKSKEKRKEMELALLLTTNFINIASNLFKYKGLEFFGEDLTSEIVERGYIFNGVNVAFKDNKLGALCLPAVASSNINVYGIPKQYIAVGYNGYTWNLNNQNAVLLRNNGSYAGDFAMIYHYCNRMADCEMAMETNINVNKMPFSLTGDPDQLLTMKNMIEQITGNKIAIYKPKKIKTASAEPIECKVLNTGAEYLADKINDSRLDYLSMLLTYLGIDNVSVEKRERLNTTEAGANDEHIKSNLYLKLKCRQEDWDKVNKMLGCNVSVEINYDFIENLKYEMEDYIDKDVSNKNEGGEDNE